LNYEAIYVASGQCLDPVVDTNTSIPGGTGRFVTFGRPNPDTMNQGEPSFEAGEVAFWGSGAGQEGIYLLSGDSLSLLADMTTAIPDGTGHFTRFGLDPSLDGGRVAFRGSGALSQQGIYLHDGNAIRVVADTNTPFPGGPGNFVDFQDFMSDGNNVAFIGIGPPIQVEMQGIYLDEGGSLRAVADLNTPIPGGFGNFTSFGPSHIPFVVPSADAGSVAFLGHGKDQSGIYLHTGGSIGVVADLNTAIPGGVGNFIGFGHNPSLSSGNVAFWGMGSGGRQGIFQGIYLYSEGSLNVVADTDTPIPGATGNFNSFISLYADGGSVAFEGWDGANSEPRGIYLHDGNTIHVVADVNTPVPRGSGTFVGLRLASADDGDVVFHGFWPGGRGIYLYDGSMIHAVADTNTYPPGGSGGSGAFYFFGGASVDDGNVAFHGTYPVPAGAEGGVYLAIGGSLSVIADEDTPIPGGSGNFDMFRWVSADGGNVAFGSSRQLLFSADGIYLYDGSTIRVVADKNTTIPGGPGDFEMFGGFSADGDRVVFQGRGRYFPPQQGVYLHDGDAIRVVADESTTAPGGTRTFSSFSRVSTDGGDVVFAAMTSSRKGIFLDMGGSLSTVVDVNTPMPRGALFEHFDFLSFDRGDVAFQGGRSFDPVSGEYEFQGNYMKTVGSPLVVVSDWLTPIPGRGFYLNYFRSPSMDAGSVAFYGGRWSNTSTLFPIQLLGIYLHDGDTLRVVADIFSPVPFRGCPQKSPRSSSHDEADTQS
jgi:hypothetical protein